MGGVYMTRVLRVHGEVRARALMVDIVEQTGLAAVTFRGSHASSSDSFAVCSFYARDESYGGLFMYQKGTRQGEGFFIGLCLKKHVGAWDRV
jgi:hypothetical protein